MLVAALILVIIFIYLFVGLVLWCLCPDMELLLDLTSGLGAWVHQFFYQLVELLKGPQAREPMPLGGGLEKVPLADGDFLGMSTPLPMNNSGNGEGQSNRALGTIYGPQGQGGQPPEQGGRRGQALDLNEAPPPPDPEVESPHAFRRAMDKLTEIMKSMNTGPRHNLMPEYDAVESIHRDAYVRSVISSFLKTNSPEDLEARLGQLQAVKKSSMLYRDFERYLLQLQGRGEA